MIDTLRWLLHRAELEHAGPITAQEVKRWPVDVLEQFVGLGLLRPMASAASIRYDGCDHGCVIEPEIITHAITGERFGAHHCMRAECGLVRINLDTLRQWAFDLLSVANAVACAIDAGGQVVEDVPGRLVAMGSVLVADTCRDVFLARGLAWSDANSALADARRLKASAAPLVLALADLPHRSIWSDCKPAIAALADIASFNGRKIMIDLGAVVQRPTKPHPDSTKSDWLTVTEAAKRLLDEDVLDGLDLARAKTLVSTAASRDRLVSNDQGGRARRIESGSLAAWILEQRRKNLAEDIDAPRPKRGRASGGRARQPFR